LTGGVQFSSVTAEVLLRPTRLRLRATWIVDLADSMTFPSAEAQRIIVVSNRLPFTVTPGDDGIQFDPSAGGVANGLRTLLFSAENSPAAISEYIWVGWPGNTINAELREIVRAKALSEFACYPVFLSGDDFEKFYEGFCNKTIWPLFHYFTSNAQYDDTYWQQYQKVNEGFCAALLEMVRPSDVLWIHDYHLMLLPDLLRKVFPKIRIGFFLHIPFPQFEIFRMLPGKWRREILQGLLGADFIGFHTHDYAEYFLRSVHRILGREHCMGELLVNDRPVRVGAAPMGIDFRKFHDAAATAEVQSVQKKLQQMLGDSKIVLSVDRQDYSKGILHRLQGFEAMLELNPEWRGRVTLVMVVVPSRIGIADYEGMKKQIEELVGRINGKFATIGWNPIIYQYRALPFDVLVALYAMSHVALVTPLRDGMNLVAKEYVASRQDKTGVLVLSEMAGAAKELPEAIIINPNNREEVASALKAALEMDVTEQVRRNTIMQDRLRRYDVTHWAMNFLTELLSMDRPDEPATVKSFSFSARAKLIRHYCQSKRRLLVFDYDGTLVPFAPTPDLAKPNPTLLRILRALCSDPKNNVVLATGRDRATLDQWFSGVGLGFAAEHGVWIKERDGTWTLLKFLDVDWKKRIFPTLEMYANRLAGAFVEEKEYSLAWHYRGADPEQGTTVARELTDHLLAFTANIDVQVLRGSKVIEIRNPGINKGVAVQQWLSKTDFDFILAIGDDWTDEDTFAILPPRAYSFRLGVTGRTHARYSLEDPGEVMQFLEDLVGMSSGAALKERLEVTVPDF
jgi:trehalose 6-phosphate synthase/phosphatase